MKMTNKEAFELISKRAQELAQTSAVKERCQLAIGTLIGAAP